MTAGDIVRAMLEIMALPVEGICKRLVQGDSTIPASIRWCSYLPDQCMFQMEFCFDEVGGPMIIYGVRLGKLSLTCQGKSVECGDQMKMNYVIGHREVKEFLLA